MPIELRNLILITVIFLALFTIAELLHRKLHVPSEWSRKFLHVAGGLVSLALPHLFSSLLYITILAGGFFLLLFFTWVKGMLTSVHKVNRKTIGSILFPFPILLCFYAAYFFDNYILFYIPVLILAFADPAAFAIGKLFPWKPYHIGSAQKTGSGSLAFAVTCFICCLIAGEPGTSSLFTAILITVAATIAESISPWGLDNVTVPVTALLILLAG